MSEASNFNTWEKFFCKNTAAQASNNFIKSNLGKITDGSPYQVAHSTYAKEPEVFLMNYCPASEKIHLYHMLETVSYQYQHS